MDTESQPKTTSESATEKLRIFAVINPVAGTSDCAEIIHAFNQAVENGNYTFDFHEWKKGEDLTPVIKTANQKGYDRFVAIGGDGTFAGVANQLVNKGIPVAFVPAGSTNALARDLGIPLRTEDAIQLALNGTQTRVLDAMQVGDTYFFLNVGAGFSGEAIENTKREEKRKMAWLAYIVAGFKQLSGLNLKLFDLTIDDRRLARRAVEVSVTNLGLMGLEPFRWSEDVQPDDGRIEVHIISTRSLIDYVELGFNFIFHRSRELDALEVYPVKEKVIIRSTENLRVQADGEVIGETPVEVRLVPKSIAVIVPEEKG